MTKDSSVALYLVGAIGTVSAIIWFMQSRKRAKQPFLIPRAPGYPIIGNALDFLPESSIKTCEDIVKKHGKYVEFVAFSSRFLMIADAAISKEILMKRPKYFRRPLSLDYSSRKMNLFTGLFSTHGAKWSRIRKLTSPVLSKHHVVNNLKSMLAEGTEMVARMKTLTNGENNVFELKNQIFQYTLRVICQAAFGMKLTDDKAEYFLGESFPRDILKIFHFMMESVTFPLPLFLFKWLPYFGKLEREALEADSRFNRLTHMTIDEKRRELASNPSRNDRFSVIDLLLNKENVPTDVEGGDITDAEIVANVKTFFIAGSDTTSVVLTWAVFAVSQQPDLLEELRVEIDAFFSRYDTEADNISGEELYRMLSKDSMPLANAVVKEVTRLYNPGPMIFSQLESRTENHTLSNGLVIEPDVQVITFIEELLVDETVYDDPKAFRPKRWLSRDAAKMTKMEENYVAFGYGARVCPGMQLAWEEALIGLITLFRHYDFALACPVEKIHRVFPFVAMPKSMPMTIHPREK